VRALAQLSGALIAALAIVGCGGSKHPSTTSSASTTASTPTTSTAASAPTTPGTTTTASPKPKPKAKPNSNTTTSSSGGVSAQPSTTSSGGSSPGTKVKSPAGGSSNARVPATFTIRANKVTPATVSAPAFLAVQLTAVSGDGQPHTVVVKLPEGPRKLTVPAHGRASVLIPGLKAGEYAVEIDGKTRAVLLIGGEPGP
jgi:hypothetical protein